MNSNTKTAQAFALSKGLTSASVAEFNMGDDEGTLKSLRQYFLLRFSQETIDAIEMIMSQSKFIAAIDGKNEGRLLLVVIKMASTRRIVSY
jgi:hypothetical protein